MPPPRQHDAHHVDCMKNGLQVYGLHPALIDIGTGATLLVEVFPMAGGGETPCKLRVAYVKPLGNPGRADFLTSKLILILIWWSVGSLGCPGSGRDRYANRLATIRH